jgi:hypothetical protein
MDAHDFTADRATRAAISTLEWWRFQQQGVPLGGKIRLDNSSAAVVNNNLQRCEFPTPIGGFDLRAERP